MSPAGIAALAVALLLSLPVVALPAPQRSAELIASSVASDLAGAIAMYESYLEERPLDPRDGAIRLRLGRMRLGRSTSYYRYWCLWD